VNEGASGVSRFFGATKLQPVPGADNPGYVAGRARVYSFWSTVHSYTRTY